MEHTKSCLMTSGWCQTTSKPDNIYVSTHAKLTLDFGVDVTYLSTFLLTPRIISPGSDLDTGQLLIHVATATAYQSGQLTQWAEPFMAFCLALMRITCQQTNIQFISTATITFCVIK